MVRNRQDLQELPWECEAGPAPLTTCASLARPSLPDNGRRHRGSPFWLLEPLLHIPRLFPSSWKLSGGVYAHPGRVDFAVAAARSTPLRPNSLLSSLALGVPNSPASGAPGPTSELQRASKLAAAVPSLADCRTPPVVRGRAGADAGQCSAANGWGGGPGPDSHQQITEEGSGPYLGSRTLAAWHVLLAAGPKVPVLGGGIPGLPQNRNSCAFMPTAQNIPPQVDMAMDLQRLKVAEKFGKNYLCLLQTAFVAGRCPPASTARRPQLLPNSLARSSPLALPPQPARPACTLCLPSPSQPHRARTPVPASVTLPAPVVRLSAAAALQGAPFSPLRATRRTVRKCRRWGEGVSAVAGLGLFSILPPRPTASVCHQRGGHGLYLPNMPPVEQEPASRGCTSLVIPKCWKSDGRGLNNAYGGTKSIKELGF